MGRVSVVLPLLCWFISFVTAQEASETLLGIKDLEVAFLSSDGSVVSKDAASYPSAPLKSLGVGPQQQLEVTFSVSGPKPQQVMVLIISKASGATGTVLAKSKKGSTYSAVLNPASLATQLGSLTGEFEVVLLVGSSSVSKAVRWSLGTVVLSGPSSKPAHRSIANQRHVFVRPEIHHIFRAPDKRAPAPVSLAFAGLALAPLLLVFIGAGVVGANFKGFPANSSGFWSLLFHGGIGAMLALYLLFWLKLNLAQTLPLIAVLGLVTAFVGYKALSGLAELRLKKD